MIKFSIIKEHVNCNDVLRFLGCNPAKTTSGDTLYSSPLRPGDNNPSFAVPNRDPTRWTDFGTDAHGDVIDLVVALGRAATLREAGEWLANAFFLDPDESDTSSPPFIAASLKGNEGDRLKPHKDKNNSDDRIVLVKGIEHTALIDYLGERKIPLAIAEQYLREVHYVHQGSPFFGLGFMNDYGGYAVRSKLFKRAFAPSAITTIKAWGYDADDTAPEIAVFEGFFNLLSFIVDQGEPECEVVVLNSVNNLHMALPMIGSFPIVSCYLDRDRPGAETLLKIVNSASGKVTDRSIIYTGYNDYNDYLVDR